MYIYRAPWCPYRYIPVRPPRVAVATNFKSILGVSPRARKHSQSNSFCSGACDSHLEFLPFSGADDNRDVSPEDNKMEND
jgi:hypothetical protein